VSRPRKSRLEATIYKCISEDERVSVGIVCIDIASDTLTAVNPTSLKPLEAIAIACLSLNSHLAKEWASKGIVTSFAVTYRPTIDEAVGPKANGPLGSRRR
jgi:hypothetical protein